MFCEIQEHFLTAALTIPSDPWGSFFLFIFSVCKFTFLTSVNLQFGPHPPELFTSCNVWFSNL